MDVYFLEKKTKVANDVVMLKSEINYAINVMIQDLNKLRNELIDTLEASEEEFQK